MMLISDCIALRESYPELRPEMRENESKPCHGKCRQNLEVFEDLSNENIVLFQRTILNPGI
jgi:hypothetical protein